MYYRYLVGITVLLLLSTKTFAEYYSFENESGGSIRFVTTASNLTPCNGKELLCYSGETEILLTAENGKPFTMTASDSQMTIKQGAFSFSSNFSPTATEYSFVDDVNISFKTKENKDGTLSSELHLMVKGDHPEEGKFNFNKKLKYDNVSAAFSIKPPSEVPLPAPIMLFSASLMMLGLIGRKRNFHSV